MRTTNIIQSDRHEVYSVEVNKVALSSKGDERHVLPKNRYVSSCTSQFKKLIAEKWYRRAGHTHNNIIYRLLKIFNYL